MRTPDPITAIDARDPGTTSTDLDLSDRLGTQLIRLLRAAGRSRSKVVTHGPDGLERLAYTVLFCLVHEGPQRTGRLAELLHAEASTISRQTRSLVGHGLVERRADPVDGRACVLAATAEGERVLEENRRLRNRWLARLLADWPAADRSILIELLEQLVSGIENATGTADSNGA